MRSRPTAERLLAVIERRGFVSAHDLTVETGVSTGNQSAALAPDVAAGVIRVDVDPVRRRGRIGVAYCWVGGAPKPVEISPSRNARPIPDPKRAAIRVCLSCEEGFRSDSAANRICPACTQSNARSSCGRYDQPAQVRYR